MRNLSFVHPMEALDTPLVHRVEYIALHVMSTPSPSEAGLLLPSLNILSEGAKLLRWFVIDGLAASFRTAKHAASPDVFAIVFIVINVNVTLAGLAEEL